jgi:hypothetical protein
VVSAGITNAIGMKAGKEGKQAATGSQTPQFGRLAWLAVTDHELALVELKGSAGLHLEQVIERIPRSEVASAELGRGVLFAPPLTVGFTNGDIWRLEVPITSKKQAKELVHPPSAMTEPATFRPAHGPSDGCAPRGALRDPAGAAHRVHEHASAAMICARMPLASRPRRTGRVVAGLIAVATVAWLLQASSAGAASNGEIAVVDSDSSVGLSAIVLIPSDRLATSANSTIVVSGPGTIGNLQWTPDGKTLVYDETARNRTDLYAVDVASTQRTLLAANLPISFDGVVSPDGTTVAYWRQSGHAFALDLVGLDGRSPRKLIAGLDPTWSADGSRLALLTAAGRIETIGADGSGEQSAGRVRNPAGRVIEPGLITSFAWAPDGESFLVSAFYTSSGNLVETVASTGRTLHVLSKKAIAFAAWSPDGTQAAFTETHSKTGEAAVVVNAGGSGLHTAYTSLGLIDLAWSPDGTSIVTADGDRVRIVDADGTHPMVLAYPGENHQLNDPAWQPLP